MARYFAELAYKGTYFCGWQKQEGQHSVQAAIEEALFTILRERIEVLGCGRTDTGVHARQYFLHFDFAGTFPEHFLSRLNRVVGADVAFYRIDEVAPQAHARFDAVSRSYEYHIETRKNPFSQESAYFFPQSGQLNFTRMQEAANLLLQYEEFYPFCKSNTDVKTMKCFVQRSEWIKEEQSGKMIFYITANRFLRGMVRLIVGMCINLGMGNITLDELKAALESQSRLKRSHSVPPQGLFLTDIVYPFMPA